MVPTHFSALFAMGEQPARLQPQLAEVRDCRHRATVAGDEGAGSWSTSGEGKLFERYGSTEASIVTALRPKDQLRKQQCVGLPLAATQIRILDANGKACAAGAGR